MHARSAAFALLLLVASCGEPAAPPPPTPAEALSAVRAAHRRGDADEVARRLEAWPEGGAYAEASESRVALTWRIRARLEAGRLEAAQRDLGRLIERFGGDGISPEGRELDEAAIALGILDEHLRRARARVEGPRPAPDAARAVLAGIGALADYEDARDTERRLGVTRWIDLATATDLGEALGWSADAHDGPRVLVFTDDFTLGEPVFAGVLERWQRQGKERDLRVGVVPLLRGQVRVNLRRMPAGSEEEELASIRSRAEKHGLALEPGLAGDAFVRTFAIEPQGVAVIIADADGRILGRLSGRNLDPRGLETVYQRLTSR